jgi:hypothetical protein
MLFKWSEQIACAALGRCSGTAVYFHRRRCPWVLTFCMGSLLTELCKHWYSSSSSGHMDWAEIGLLWHTFFYWDVKQQAFITGWAWTISGRAYYTFLFKDFLFGAVFLQCLSELRKPANSASTLAEHSVILQEHFDRQHSKFTFLSKIQPNFKTIHSIISHYLYCLCIPQLPCVYMSDYMCIYLKKPRNTQWYSKCLWNASSLFSTLMLIAWHHFPLMSTIYKL